MDVIGCMYQKAKIVIEKAELYSKLLRNFALRVAQQR